MIIGIDGPSAAGKGTLALRLAEKLSLAYLDTGSLYRAVGLKLLREGKDPENATEATQVAEDLSPTDPILNDSDLRIEAAGVAASKTSAIPGVRSALLDFQRRFAHNPPENAKGAVLDGRDIGTVVCPNADFKLFITASTEKRAERRFLELQEKGIEAIYDRVLSDMVERDKRDSSRAVAPLTAAEDAFVLDTSDLDADAVFDRVMTHINAAE